MHDNGCDVIRKYVNTSEIIYLKNDENVSLNKIIWGTLNYILKSDFTNRRAVDWLETFGSLA